MKKAAFVISFLVLFQSSLFAAASHVTSTCPVMPGEPAKEKFYVDYHGKRIHLCCKNCIIKFKHNPEKYLPNVKEN